MGKTKSILNILVYCFAIIGFVLVFGYFAVKFGWTNEKGIIDRQNEAFYELGSLNSTENSTLDIKEDTATASSQKNLPQWAVGEEWEIFKKAVSKDINVIREASAASDIKERLIVAQLVVEQLRLYHTNRAIFKSVFAPLKLLGNQSQFSWGIMGIKQNTAKQIERNLKLPDSPFYPGKKYEHLLDFKTDNPDKEHFDRIVDEKNHYYAYLYAGLYLKEVETQWKKAGYDISNRPDVLSTLFNIGFDRSMPSDDPKVGGSRIDIGKKTYSFGGLADEFYHSDELIQEFPR